MLKIIAATVAAGFCFSVPLPVQEAAPVTELAKEDLPESLIEKIDVLLNDDGPTEVVSPEQLRGILKKTIESVDAVAARFRKLHPAHPKRWQIRFHEAMMLTMREEAGLPVAKGETVASILGEILAAPDAEAEVKLSAASTRLEFLSGEVLEKRLPLESWEKESSEFLKANPEYPDAVVIAEMHVELVGELAPERLDALLKDLSQGKNVKISELAQDKIAEAKARAEMKSKPLELKFTALDGREVDLEKLRGKVVLVDFWATWCGPCMAELPSVIKTYEALKDKGFEIVGISLDEEKSELEKTLKRRKITWPQFFDGTGWDNKIAKRFGITAIPTMWLINKKGMVVEMNSKNDLQAKIEKLLAEVE